MAKWILIILALVLSATTVYAADNKTVLLASSYTYLAKECKWAYTEKELSAGQDNALTCKGFGKYQIFIYFSAMNSHLSIRLKDAPDTVVFEQAVNGIDEKRGVVEWRTAGGIPFAIIVRSKEYSSMEEGRKPLKESLVVRGLGQYSAISGLVDVKKNMDANKKARTLADEAFMTIINSNH
jgi:hypothetical protein